MEYHPNIGNSPGVGFLYAGSIAGLALDAYMFVNASAKIIKKYFAVFIKCPV